MGEVMNCPICGGDIIGDGITMVKHCENAEVPFDIEPDAATIVCQENKYEKS